ncbi:MAG: hypothetical protein F6K55_27610 [Moorea sp. SIO4A3]|nr:hypothetical protein [Moorena sp. SIO4A3]
MLLQLTITVYPFSPLLIYIINRYPCRNSENFCSLCPTPYSLLPTPCSLIEKSMVN